MQIRANTIARDGAGSVPLSTGPAPSFSPKSERRIRRPCQWVRIRGILMREALGCRPQSNFPAGLRSRHLFSGGWAWGRLPGRSHLTPVESRHCMGPIKPRPTMRSSSTPSRLSAAAE